MYIRGSGSKRGCLSWADLTMMGSNVVAKCSSRTFGAFDASFYVGKFTRGTEAAVDASDRVAKLSQGARETHKPSFHTGKCSYLTGLAFAAAKP